MIRFSDIQEAFFFVSSDGYGMHSALVCKDTGQILYRSEIGDVDEIEGKDLHPDMCVAIPHKNDLNLGQSLVLEFVETHTPDDYDRVRKIFRKPGAYGRF